jgi:outer membrane protein
MQKVFNQFKGKKEAQTQLEMRTNAWRANVDSLSVDLMEGMKKIDVERRTLSKKELELSERLLMSKQNQYQQYRKSVEEKITLESEKITSSIVEGLSKQIKEYAIKQGLQLVIASNNGNILYGDEALDITDKIILEVNK